MAKRIPSHLKVVAGTDQPCRMNANEPKLKSSVPDMPKTLTKNAKAYWRFIVPKISAMGILTDVDGTALQMLCETYAEWIDLCHKITAFGDTTYETEKDGLIMHRSRPEVAQRSDAARRLQSLLAEFGITPAARSKVSATNVPGVENRFAKFGK